MDRIYIKAWYLKTLHYFFFSVAVFSMSAGIMFFDLFSWESLSFFILGWFYCVSSLTIAYYYYRDYRETLEPFRIIKLYFTPYIILVFWTVISMAILLWIFPSLSALIYSFLFVNYYIFFIIIIGFVSSRFKIVSNLFEVYNRMVFNKALELAGKHAFAVNVSEYKIGSHPQIDELLDEIWAHKDYPLPYVRKLEIAICDKKIVEINRTLEKLRKGKATDATKRVIKALEEEKKDYMDKIVKIKKKVD